MGYTNQCVESVYIHVLGMAGIRFDVGDAVFLRVIFCYCD